jgi:hypothetical protein
MSDGFGVIEKRFLSNLVKTKNCWNWKRSLGSGYGRFQVNKIRMLAHRFSYMIYVGSIMENKLINHKCRNKKCVNPSHLEEVTAQQNTNYFYNGSGD